MRQIGFSTGAVATSDFSLALQILAPHSQINSIELSALRLQEAEPLLQAIPGLNLEQYRYISFHAPSAFAAEDEVELVRALDQHVPIEWPIVLHPDAIHNYSHWHLLGGRVAIENMDRRKSMGRTAQELHAVFERLPDAKFCFDIGHARQCDTSMAEAYRILEQHGSRLAQVHVSEVTSASQHEPITFGTKLAFQSVAHLIHENVPLIIESRVPPAGILKEIEAVLESLPSSSRFSMMPA